ncbi:unnamed protein product [Rodentolepis nana]|uniref:RVT_N domain-containing protein n=1 Tax=Rodentolepis nana TaxID=102285 RepID=A0A0R3THT7_RODNA|nr:unnamed protein product [Rodentolepis nana]
MVINTSEISLPNIFIGPPQHKSAFKVQGFFSRKTNEFTYLGVTFDKKLSWKSHTAKVAERISNRLSALKRLVGNTKVHSLIKGKALTLYQKLLRNPRVKFFRTYKNRPTHLMQKAIELKKALQIAEKPENRPLFQQIGHFRKADTPPDQMLSLALVTNNVNYPADQWL